jgi:tRNA nucleotidyltransferase/poly(A) polymerase
LEDISPEGLAGRVRDLQIVARVSGHLFTGKIYLVGGALRELFLNREPQDYDFVLSERADLSRFEEIFAGPSFVLGKKPIQTHRIVTHDMSIDITFLKGTIEDDLARRDFTMNAIAWELETGMITDPFGGMADIKKGMIRYTHREALRDDPLRMLKAIRHAATLAGFNLDNNLLEAIKELRTIIHEAAAERIKYEMDQIITGEHVFAALKLMDRLGLTFEIFPELSSLKQMDEEQGFTLETYGHTIDAFLHLRSEQALWGLDEKALRNVGYALLFHDLGKAYTFSFDENKRAVHFYYHERFSKEIALAIMERLRFSSQEIKTVLALIESHMRIFLLANSESTEKGVRRIVYKMGDLTPSLVVLTLCDMYGSSGGQDNESTERVRERCAAVMRVYDEWKKEPLPGLINGNDLLAMGFQQGPIVGRILDDIREKQIAGEVTTREEALAYVEGSEIRR